jgi:hypothetical protein
VLRLPDVTSKKNLISCIRFVGYVVACQLRSQQPRHGASSDYGRRIRRLDMEGSCYYIYEESQTVDKVSSFTVGLVTGKNTIGLGYNVMKGTEYCLSL